MTGYAANPYTRLPETPRTSGSSRKAPEFLKAPGRVLEAFFNACQAAAEYERRLVTTKHENAGDVARQVFAKYFDGR